MKSIFKIFGCFFASIIVASFIAGCTPTVTQQFYVCENCGISYTSEFDKDNCSNIMGCPGYVYLDSIEITNLPNKLCYVVGESFSYEGIKCVSNLKSKNGFSNQEEIQNSDLTFSGFDSSSTTAKQTITVSYTSDGIEKSASFDIEITDKALTEISVYYYPRSYYIGDTFDRSSVEYVEAHYNDGSKEYVDTWTADYDFTVAGEKQPVVVSYAGPGSTQTATLYFTVIGFKNLSVYLNSSAKKEYWVEDEFDTTGISTYIYYTNGKSEKVTDVVFSGFDSSVANDECKVTVSYTKYGVTTSTDFTVAVKAWKLDSIKLTKNPLKTEYWTGDEFDSSGIEVTATYTNQKSKVVTGWYCKGFNSSKPATNQYISVYYSENGFRGTSFKINIYGLDSITLNTSDVKTKYFIGESSDFSNLQVTANYTNGTSNAITDWTCSGFDSSSANENQTITVTYTDRGITKTADFVVQIISKSLTKIELTSEPTKKEYWVGDDFDSTGLQVKAYYDDGSTDFVTDWTTDFDSSEPSKSKTVTITYSGPGATKSDSFVVKIKKEYIFQTIPKNLPAGTDGTLGTSGKYVLFGDYPQTLKEDDVKIHSNITMEKGEFTYYQGDDGNWYAKKDSNYYKVEPIKWRVLTTNYNNSKAALLLAENILNYGKKFILGGSSKYTTSDVYDYLNGKTGTKWADKGFRQTALNYKCLLSTKIDNSAESTIDADGNLDKTKGTGLSQNTSEDVFLLSEREVTTSDYGFAAYNVSDNARKLTNTNFASEVSKALSVYCSGSWILRSAYGEEGFHYETNYMIRTINNGYANLGTYHTNAEGCGIVPAITINNGYIK